MHKRNSHPPVRYVNFAVRDDQPCSDRHSALPDPTLSTPSAVATKWPITSQSHLTACALSSAADRAQHTHLLQHPPPSKLKIQNDSGENPFSAAHRSNAGIKFPTCTAYHLRSSGLSCRDKGIDPPSRRESEGKEGEQVHTHAAVGLLPHPHTPFCIA